MVAVMNDNPSCRNIRIVGDSVSGIFNTPTVSGIDAAFSTAARISSVVDVINYKMEKRSIQQITVGIGMDYGRALMVKAGYKGSGINDVVWMGDVVNYACKLCGFGNKTYSDGKIMVSHDIYNNLNDHNKKLLTLNHARGCYHGNIINVEINEWLQNQQTKATNNQFGNFGYRTSF